MNRALAVGLLLLAGCAQFGGMESESRQGFIPELLLIGYDAPTPEELLADEQAKYYTSSLRALYFQNRLEQVASSDSKKSYAEKILKAREMAQNAESQVLNLSQ